MTFLFHHVSSCFIQPWFSSGEPSRPRALETSLRSSLETFSTWGDGQAEGGAWCLVPMVISLGKDGMVKGEDDALEMRLGMVLVLGAHGLLGVAGDDLVANGW